MDQSFEFFLCPSFLENYYHSQFDSLSKRKKDVFGSILPQKKLFFLSLFDIFDFLLFFHDFC
jgi:hypothetical protein